MSGGPPYGAAEHMVAQAISGSAAATLARRQWAMPVANAGVSVGLLSLYLGVVWTRTLPTGAASSRFAAVGMIVVGVAAIAGGHVLRRSRIREVREAIEDLSRPPELGTRQHLRASNHQVPRRTFRRQMTRCGSRVPDSTRPLR